MAAINTYQVRKIYAIAGALGMKSRDGDDALHDLVFGMTGKQHISGLTSAEAYDVIAELEKKQGSNPTPRRRGRPQRPTAPGHASEGQCGKVWHLMYRLNELSPSKSRLADRLRGIIKKELGMDSGFEKPLAWLSYQDCSKLIEILKAYIASAEKKAGGANGRVGSQDR